MRHLTNLIFVIFLLVIGVNPSYSAIQGNIEYKIPVDYSNLDENELASRADIFYTEFSDKTTCKLNDNLTAALNIYSMLSNKNPQNITYALRLGKLYDIIGKDRYAKGNYYRAMGVNPSAPEPYFYLGEFFYVRKHYRKALKFYLRAYSSGYSNHRQTCERLKEIYKKFGDKENLAKFE